MFLKTGVFAFLLFMFLFVDVSLQSSFNFIGSALREITAVLRDSETQWMVFLCLGIYFVSFLFLRSRVESLSTQRRKRARAVWWLVYVLFTGAVLYAIDSSPSVQALTLIGGVAIGQGVAIWAGFNAKSSPLSAFVFALLLVLLLALASIWQTDAGRLFEYRHHARWSGPWDNPNVAGLLMGTGIALAVGGVVSSFQFLVFSQAYGRSRVWKLLCAALCLLAAILMFRALFHSYSRGAWLATGCGLAYSIGSGVWRPASGGLAISHGSSISRLQRNWLPIFVILLSAILITFWHFRQTDWHPAHRAFSVGNQDDFSWRNRTAAWEGALQITGENPWFGAGWNQPSPLYDSFYLPPKLTESAAIEMNDYLMLGATLGIPALFCFGMYVWLNLGDRRWEIGDRGKSSNLDWLQMTCRAGAIVLLVGFWFDGGLFKLATASTFWILLELGSADWIQQKVTEETKTDTILA